MNGSGNGNSAAAGNSHVNGSDNRDEKMVPDSGNFADNKDSGCKSDYWVDYFAYLVLNRCHLGNN